MKKQTDQIVETKIQKVIIFEILKLEIEFFCNESNYALYSRFFRSTKTDGFTNSAEPFFTKSNYPL